MSLAIRMPISGLGWYLKEPRTFQASWGPFLHCLSIRQRSDTTPGSSLNMVLIQQKFRMKRISLVQ